MDYELMMNGTVKIGQPAPDFTAETTYGNVCLNDYKGKWLVSLKWNKNGTKSIVRRLIRKIIINWKKKLLNI